MESLLDIVIEESRDLKMEDILPNMQIGVMGFLAHYGFVILFQQIYGATIGGKLLLETVMKKMTLAKKLANNKISRILVQSA